MNTIEEVEAAACVLEDYDMLEEAKRIASKGIRQNTRSCKRRIHAIK